MREIWDGFFCFLDYPVSSFSSLLQSAHFKFPAVSKVLLTDFLAWPDHCTTHIFWKVCRCLSVCVCACLSVLYGNILPCSPVDSCRDFMHGQSRIWSFLFLLKLAMICKEVEAALSGEIFIRQIRIWFFALKSSPLKSLACPCF